MSRSARGQFTSQSKQSFDDQYRSYQFLTQNIPNISPIFVPDRNIKEHNPCKPKETVDESTLNNVIPQVQIPEKGNYSLINKDKNNSSPKLENVNLPPVTELSKTSKQNDPGMKNDKYCKEICDTWDFSNKKIDSDRKYRSTHNRKNTELIIGSDDNAAELMYSFEDMYLS